MPPERSRKTEQAFYGRPGYRRSEEGEKHRERPGAKFWLLPLTVVIVGGALYLLAVLLG